MNFFKKIINKIDLVLNTEVVKMNLSNYVDLGNGLPWFNDYRNRGCVSPGEFFDFNKDAKLEIKAQLDKITYYQTPKGRRWALMANYFDEKTSKKWTFYFPELDYYQVRNYIEGQDILVFVDYNDYSKYEIPM